MFREVGARLVGAEPGEVVFMNSLTVNLHLMLATFYQPTRERFRILTDEPTFPSDLYALQTHLRHRGQDPARRAATSAYRGKTKSTSCWPRAAARSPSCCSTASTFSPASISTFHDIVAAAHKHGCVAGLDLAHAAGNVVLKLHEWNVDFAVWCSYKYLNGGPGAVGGCFVHEKHGQNLDLPRLAGWWGNDPATRFRMHSGAARSCRGQAPTAGS